MRSISVCDNTLLIHCTLCYSALSVHYIAWGFLCIKLRLDFGNIGALNLYSAESFIFCSSKDQKDQPKLWLEFKRAASTKVKGQITWSVEEVPLDTHSDESYNRVYTLKDHTLVIKQFAYGKKIVLKKKLCQKPAKN